MVSVFLRPRDGLSGTVRRILGLAGGSFPLQEEKREEEKRVRKEEKGGREEGQKPFSDSSDDDGGVAGAKCENGL